MRATLIMSLFFCCMLSACSTPKDPEPTRLAIVPAAEARQHLDEICTVEMTVRSSKHEVDKELYYLDSEADYKDPRNLAVVILEKHLPAFRDQGIDQPNDYYQGKRIRVTGNIIFEDDQYQINVREPGQIEMVKTPDAGDVSERQ